MIQHPEFNPVAISIGPVSVHWYGLMYLLGFAGGVALGIYRSTKTGFDWTRDQVWDLLFYVAMGVILGGRLGYVLFYKAGYYISHPLEIFYLWQGGMSFHGGLIGVLVAMAWYAHKNGRSFWNVTDFLAPLVTVGLGAGRLGNFINQELWGRVSDAPWAVVFPAVDNLPRHPSQLYEAMLEGVVLFILLWWYSAKPRTPGKVSGLFLLGYSVSRFIVEFFREPDAHLGYLAFGWLTMGQVLTLPMFLIGIWLMLGKATTRREKE